MQNRIVYMIPADGTPDWKTSIGSIRYACVDYVCFYLVNLWNEICEFIWINSRHLRVFQHSVEFIRPNDNAFIGTAGCKFLAIMGICDSVHSVFVTRKCFDESTFIRFIHQHFIVSSNNQLNPVWMKAHWINPVDQRWNVFLMATKKCAFSLAHLPGLLFINVLFVNFLNPFWNGPHFKLIQKKTKDINNLHTTRNVNQTCSTENKHKNNVNNVKNRLLFLHWKNEIKRHQTPAQMCPSFRDGKCFK